MCEAIKNEYNKLQFEVLELKEELHEKITDWNNHFEWLKSLNTIKGPVEKIPTKLLLTISKAKDVFNILLDVLKWNTKWNIKLFLKRYYRKREQRILKRIDKIQAKSDKKILKKYNKCIIFREKWFQKRINLGEVI